MNDSLLNIIADVLTESNKVSSSEVHLNPKGELKKFIDAQTVGKPLVKKDGSPIKNTMYLGDGSYLVKQNAALYLVTAGRIRVDGDDSLDWDAYMSYDSTVRITPAVLKTAASLAGKV